MTAAMPKKRIPVEVAGREVSISSPDKIYFPEAGYTKWDVIQYFLAVADAALETSAGRPLVLKRYVNGTQEEAFYQKRAPKKRPEWIDTVVLKFPSGRTAEEVVLHDAAQLLWCANLGCLELHVHAVSEEDLHHPDELRIDLDPVPGVSWAQVRDVAFVTKDALADLGLVGWPKTSGSRGMHINVAIHPEWTFDEVRQSALAIARDVERRAPKIATSRWWKEERHGVFLDYNQNAKDRTTAGALSVRPLPDARVSMPLTWEEVAEYEPEAFTIRTAPDRIRDVGNVHRDMRAELGRLDKALELVSEQALDGATDAPWPPHYPKGGDEPPRVQPSKRRRSSMPLIEIGRAKQKDDAMAGLERWKARHADVVEHLQPRDILVDKNRGRHTVWYRIRINLQHVPEELRPAQEPLDPDYDPAVEWGGSS
jgi:bifunctional non-homologous end joining protein LigD